MIQVRLNAAVRNIHTDNGTEFVNQTLQDYYEQVGISHETSVARTPQQNGVVERRNRTLVEATRTMLIYAKAPLYLWAKVVATAYYTQNRSIIRRRHGKTPYELLHDIKPDLSYLHVFGALCYPNNDSENLGKLQAKADIGIFIRYAPKKKAYRIYNQHKRKIIETIHVDFNELTTMASEQSSLEPAFVASPVPVEEAPAPIESTGLPSLTIVDQDAPSPSTSQTTPQSQSQAILLSAEEESHDLEVEYMSNDPYFGIPIPETVFEESSSSDIEAMQGELNEFECLKVWELVPPLDKVMVITLKWIYKVKLDESGGILKNKARLVAHGYRQEEGSLNTEESASQTKTGSQESEIIQMNAILTTI
ncbi:retrovirus-related pol polyprotein from transposon TNT 1-94 [Tanacetum coccineum]